MTLYTIPDNMQQRIFFFFHSIFNRLSCFYMKHNKIIEENISEFIRWLEKCSFINCINLAWGRFETLLNDNRDTFVRSVFCSEGSLFSTKNTFCFASRFSGFGFLKELLPSIHQSINPSLNPPRVNKWDSLGKSANFREVCCCSNLWHLMWHWPSKHNRTWRDDCEDFFFYIVLY